MPTIINLRGTGGSGKSTVVRSVMARYRNQLLAFKEGRRQPSSYLCQYPDDRTDLPALYVPGHYETACGGCDTIKTPDEVYAMVRGSALGWGRDVLYEGIIVQDDTKRLLTLHVENPVHVIEMGTSIEDCLAGIQARRDARGDTRPLDPKNTVERAKRVHKTCDKLRALGMHIPILDREMALQQCLWLLGLAENSGEELGKAVDRLARLG